MLNGGTAVREAWLGYPGSPPTPTVSLVVCGCVCVCVCVCVCTCVCFCVSGKLMPGAISPFISNIIRVTKSQHQPVTCLFVRYHIRGPQSWDFRLALSNCYFEPVCSFSPVRLFTIWIVAHQAPLAMEFSRQEYWSGLSFSTPGVLSDPGIPGHLLHWQVDSVPCGRWAVEHLLHMVPF